MTKKTKFLIYPGYITSRKDGDRHYIGPMQLINLYGVDPDECVIYMPKMDLGEINDKNIKILTPREDGNYQL